VPALVVSARHGRLALGSRPSWWRGPRWRRGRGWLAFALVAVAALVVVSMGERAQDTIAGYGRLERVPVATHDLDVGRQLGTDDVAWRDLPAAAVPDGALDALPVGRIVTEPIGRGEVVTRLRIAPGGLSGLAAQIPSGRRAVSIPVPDSGLALEVGDHVDVLAPDRAASDADFGRGSATTVARDASVLAVDRGAVVLAVTADEAGPVAGTLAEGTPVLLLDGPS
jgi:Flp pilus assembly protein CpaB